eukprot:gene2863-3558_t
MKLALLNFKQNNVSDQNSIYPGLNLLLEQGVYTGPDNLMLNLYQFNITIQPLNNNNNVNLQPQTNDSVFLIHTHPNSTIDTYVTINNIGMRDMSSTGPLVIVDHTSSSEQIGGGGSIPSIYLKLNSITIQNCLSPKKGFIYLNNSTLPKYQEAPPFTKSFVTIRDSNFVGNKASDFEKYTNKIQSKSIFYNEIWTDLEINNCVFNQNQGESIVQLIGNATISVSQFLNNTCVQGCLSAKTNLFSLEGTKFIGNKAISGGAMHLSSNLDKDYTGFQSRVIDTCSFVDNRAELNGGTAIFVLTNIRFKRTSFQFRKDANPSSPLFYGIAQGENILNFEDCTFTYILSDGSLKTVPDSDFKKLIECGGENMYLFLGQLSDMNICSESKGNGNKSSKDIAKIVFVCIIIPLIGLAGIIVGIVFLVKHLKKNNIKKKESSLTPMKDDEL